MSTPKNNVFFTFLLFTSFIEGGVVMAVEILGAKMIAPFFGTSLYVWSATLAITLFGLTIGYFLGGLFSEKQNNNNFIYYILSIASILVGLMNIGSFWILTNTIELDIKTGTIISLLLYLLPPLCFLGMTSPLIINGLQKFVNNSGKSAGIVYAISTLGGILMTFVVGFILIPTKGVSMTCFYYSLLLSLIPIIYFLSQKNVKGIIVSTIATILIVAFNLNLFLTKPQTEIENVVKVKYKSEGLLGQLTVLDINKNERIICVNNMAQSAMHIQTKKTYWRYIHRILTYASVKEKGDVLVCGLGGGLLVNELLGMNYNIDVCEIDKRMEHIAKKYFYLNSGYNLHIDDARHFIKKSKKKYDIIVLDLSIGENVPTNIYTYECFSEIKKMLNEDGFLFIHYVNDKFNIGKKAVKAIGNTLKVAGFNTSMLNTTFTDKNNTEIMYFASLNKIDLSQYSYNNVPQFTKENYNIPTGKNVYDNYDFSDGLILTDDKPNIDIFHLNKSLNNRLVTNSKFKKENIKQSEILFH